MPSQARPSEVAAMPALRDRKPSTDPLAAIFARCRSSCVVPE